MHVLRSVAAMPRDEIAPPGGGAAMPRVRLASPPGGAKGDLLGMAMP